MKKIFLLFVWFICWKFGFSSESAELTKNVDTLNQISIIFQDDLCCSVLDILRHKGKNSANENLFYQKGQSQKRKLPQEPNKKIFKETLMDYAALFLKGPDNDMFLSQVVYFLGWDLRELFVKSGYKEKISNSNLAINLMTRAGITCSADDEFIEHVKKYLHELKDIIDMVERDAFNDFQ